MNLSIAHLLYANPSKDLSEKDYYSGGMVMPDRSFSSFNYPFAYNGMLKDDEIKGIGNSYTTEFRGYDPRLGGRWLSIDPLANQFPWLSPYAGMDNNPIAFNDPFGDCVDCSEEATTLNTEATAGSIPNGHTWTDANGKAFTYNESLGGPVLTNLMYDNASEFLGSMMTASNLSPTRVSDPGSEAFGDATNDIIVGLSPAGIVNDIYTAGTGKSLVSNSETQGFFRYAGIIPFVSELRGLMRIDDVVDATKGFSSYGKFKSAYGSAGEGFNWHHVVEQSKTNLANIDPKLIQNPESIVKISRADHIKISAYYSRRTELSGDVTIRKWLQQKSFQEQYEFGLQIIKRVENGESLY